MKFSPFSFSKLSTHNQCNRKFKYNYIDKIKVDKPISEALLKGGAVHSILEHYPNKSTHKLAPKYADIAIKFLKTDIAHELYMYESVREFDFGLTSELQPCEYKDKSALFRGSVDYIFTNEKGLHLIDWKTGKLKEEKWQSYEQLMFYAIYFFQRYPKIEKTTISYIYVEHENSHNTLTLERKYLQNYINQLFDLINAVETDTSFNKNVSKLCDYCDFQEICEND
jgi:CRISPR/Cas system-associated exonuclease Cas4 (RecB family)